MPADGNCRVRAAVPKPTNPIHRLRLTINTNRSIVAPDSEQAVQLLRSHEMDEERPEHDRRGTAVMNTGGNANRFDQVDAGK